MTTKPEVTPKPKPADKAVSSAVPDWERIELDYRAGVMTLRQIAAPQGITHGSITKRAKRDGWERDLKAKILAKADQLVSKAVVSKLVSTERQVIEANAIAIADVRLAHRSDINRARSITMSLLYELECQTGADNVAMLEQLGELMRSEDDHGNDRLNDLYQKIVSLPGRAKTMKDLGESLRVLVAMERQAFGLDDKDNRPVDALTSLIEGITSRNNNGFEPVKDDPERDEGDA
jgi:hypothetical protein